MSGMKRGLRAGRRVGSKGVGMSLLGLLTLLPAAAQTSNFGNIAGAGQTPFGSAFPGVGGSGLQAASSGPLWRVVKRLSVVETFTDNGRLSSTDRQAESITQPSATLSVLKTAGRVRGYLDYTLSGLYFARGTSPNSLQNSLNTSVTAEVLEKRAYIDAAATISQQAVSALGTQSVDPALASTNRTEVRTLRLTPYARGQIANFANYEARGTLTETHTSSSQIASVRTTVASASFSGLRTGRLNWSADVSRQAFNYSSGRNTQLERENAALLLTVDPQLRLSFNAGREATNFSSADVQSYATYGAGLNWAPSPRTSVNASVQHRFFGNSVTINAAYRTPRSAWVYTDTKDVSANGLTGAVGGQTTAYDLFYNAFASVQPDPTLRNTLVNDYLAANSINPSASIAAGYLASTATVRRLQQLSFTLLGLRDTLTFTGSRSDAQRISTDSVATSDFATFGRLRQTGLTANFAHRLSPLATLNLAVTQQSNTGSESTLATSQSSTLRTAFATVSTSLGRRARAPLTARHSRFENGVTPYRETAVLANISMQF